MRIKPVTLKTHIPLTAAEGQFTLPFIKKQGLLLARSPGHGTVILHTAPIPESIKKILETSLHPLPLTIALEPEELILWLGRQYGSSHGIPEIKTNGKACRLDETDEQAPVANYLNGMLIEGIRQNASDIHIGGGLVRYRINGFLVRGETIPEGRRKALINRLKIMAGLNLTECRRPQEGRLTASLRGRNWDFRLSLVPAVDGETAALRVFNRRDQPPTLEDLGFPPETVRQLRRFFSSPSGLILLAGPTGSGKSTTLNALLSLADPRERKIITLEDPVEYIREGITQIAVREERGMDYSALLKRVLRQDPDIIMVGEIRDRITARLTIRAALTGHLVLSTLHARDTATAASRLETLGIPPVLREETTIALMAQRLLRKKDGLGRIPILEICSAGRVVPLRTLADEGEILVRQGTVTREEILRVLGSGC